MAKRVLEVVHVRGVTPFARGLDLLKARQTAKIEALRAGAEVPRDCVLLLEHKPVYTLGRRADAANVLFDAAEGEAQVVRIERGGEVTYHGPGQVVAYPVLDLRRHRKDLHWYMRQVEQAVIQTLACYGLEGGRKSAYTGVWVGDRKVAAIGLNASKWITTHGLALNVTTDLAAFDRIVPCGIDEEGLGVGSLESLLGPTAAAARSDLNRMAAQERLVREIMDVFAFDRAVVDEVDLL